MSRDDTKDIQSIPSSSSSGNTLGVQMPSPRKKPNRRATAVYPNVNSSNKTSKPFSRSAAKRGSVMALGSIEHLQYYFTKAGLAAKEKPHSTSVLVPAIGGPQYIRTSPSGEEEPILDEEHFVLPPTPLPPLAVPQRPFVSSGKRDYEVNPEHLKRIAILDLKTVQDAWDVNSSSSPDNNSRDNDNVDVLFLLRCTTRTIRSVRNYVVSLPDDPTHPDALLGFHRPKPEFRPSTLQPALIKRQTYNTHSRKFSQDILYQIRQSALDVLTVLHALEESTRLPLSDEAYEVQSDHGSNSSMTTSREQLSFSSPRTRAGTLTDDDTELCSDADVSFSFSVVKVPGREGHIHVWTNEDDEALLDENNENSSKTGWDEKLVLGAGWLYQQDVKLAQLAEERAIVENYLDAVDNVLFGGPTSSSDGVVKRGWEAVKIKTDSSKRRSSGSNGFDTPPEEGSILVSGARSNGLAQALGNMYLEDGSTSPTQVRGLVGPGSPIGLDALEDLQEEDEEDSVDGEPREVPDSELPDWARRSPQSSSMVNDPLARAHAMLVHLLPTSLLHQLPLPKSPSSSDDEGDDGNEAFSPITPVQHNPISADSIANTSSNPPRPPRNPARSLSISTSSQSTAQSSSASSIPRIPFLQALSSGQLLCVAYNAALRRSKKPWGFINLESVHDVLGMEAEAGGLFDNDFKKDGRRNSKGGPEDDDDDADGTRRKVGWTFRRTDNLRLWTAALRLRYQMPISSSPMINKSSYDPPFLLFDAKTVARRDSGTGWDTMLETALLRWVEAVVNEKRRGN